MLTDEVRQNLIAAGVTPPVVVAVSGGADSVGLLLSLSLLGFAPIVAHLNHQLRGAESDQDSDFVRDLALARGHAFAGESTDIRSLGGNLEATARNVRYDFLQRVARDHTACWIATGHTADDQAETVLHHLLRGSGATGLRGIAAVRELSPGVRLVRPLLTVSRETIRTFLADHAQSWREDSSNADLNFTRNRIRHELLPLIRTFQPAATRVLNRLAGQMQEVHAELEFLAADLLLRSELPRAGRTLVLDTAILLQAPRQRVRNVFRRIWEREQFSCEAMTAEHWDRLAGIVFGELRAADFPDRVQVRRKSRVTQVIPQEVLTPGG